MNKAQGLSLNTMVMAAIALIILLVLVGIFSGYFGDFVPKLSAAGERQCSAEGFSTPLESVGCTEDEQRVYGNFGDNLDDGDICCKDKNFEAPPPPPPPPEGTKGSDQKSRCDLPDECLSSSACAARDGAPLSGDFACDGGICCKFSSIGEG